VHELWPAHLPVVVRAEGLVFTRSAEPTTVRQRQRWRLMMQMWHRVL
jgi:hypothetical protein